MVPPPVKREADRAVASLLPPGLARRSTTHTAVESSSSSMACWKVMEVVAPKLTQSMTAVPSSRA